MVARGIYDRIVALEHDYAACLDDDRLEEWPGLFVEDGRYDITTRENVEDGLPLGIFHCRNRAQMRDRVKILRNAAVFSLRYYRRLIGNVRVLRSGRGVHESEASYVVYATEVVDGTTELFSTGKYRNAIVEVDGALRFQSKIVIADTASIAKNLSVPL